MLLVPNVSEMSVLNVLSTAFNAAALHYHLYHNNHTPADNDVLADYTEATFDGYALKVVNTFAPAILIAGRAYTAADPLLWTATGGVTPNSVFGYYVTDASDVTLYWAELFTGGPIVIDSLGDTVPLVPSFTLRSEP